MKIYPGGRYITMLLCKNLCVYLKIAAKWKVPETRYFCMDIDLTFEITGDNLMEKYIISG